MLRAIEIEGFKAFGRRARIECAPITLLLGPNSSGKSSVLQALSLLRQTWKSNNPNAILLPRVEGGLVDLGSYREMVSGHDLERSVHLRLDFATSPNTGSQGNLFQPTRKQDPWLGLELIAKLDDKNIVLDSLELHAASAEDSGPLARFVPYEVALGDADDLFVSRSHWNSSRAGSSQLGAVSDGIRCDSISDHEPLWADCYAFLSSNRARVLSALRRLAEADMKNLWAQHYAGDFGVDIEDAVKFYSSDFSLAEFVGRVRARASRLMFAMDGFLPCQIAGWQLFPWEFYLSLGSLQESDPGRRRPDPIVSTLAPDFADMTKSASKMFDSCLNDLLSIGPFRSPPERWYVYSGIEPTDVGAKGRMLPDLLYRQPELVERTNAWLERLEVGYRLSLSAIGDHGDLFELRLSDEVAGQRVDVALTDVGFGIGQVLPIIVQCLADKDRLITIEQPEVHIHPRLQADIGELLADCIKAPHRHQFLVETHSEHLVLRLQKLVRLGRLRPEDVSIISVKRGQQGSTASRLRLDEHGDFIDDWPGGFFPERLKELL